MKVKEIVDMIYRFFADYDNVKEREKYVRYCLSSFFIIDNTLPEIEDTFKIHKAIDQTIAMYSLNDDSLEF